MLAASSPMMIATLALFVLGDKISSKQVSGLVLSLLGVIGQVLYLGIFASAVAFIYWNKAVFLLGPSKAPPFPVQ